MDSLEFHIIKKKLFEGESLRLKVASDSMMPVLKVGQEINVTFRPISNLKKFDTVVFFQDKCLMCHFLWAKQDKNTLITKSLKNPRDVDWPVNESDYLGFVEVNLPFFLKLKTLLKI